MDKHFEDIFGKLISFPSLPDTDNIELTEYIKTYLEKHGAKVTVSGKDTGRLRNIYASVGPDIEGGLVLSGHTDIVGTEGQDWHSNPFELLKKDGKYFGRGTCDMKGFDALIVSLVPELSRMNLKKPVCLSLAYDEETSCEGVQYVVADFGVKVPKPAMAIIGEPSELGIIAAHKGDSHLTCEVFGSEGHSSMPDKGLNAIYYAARLISKLESMYIRFSENPVAGSTFDPPYPSLSVGKIRGGTSVNTIAGYCAFDWEMRTHRAKVNGEILDELQEYADKVLIPEMKNRCPDAGIKITRHYTSPPLEYVPDSPVIRLLEKHVDDKKHSMVSFGTEAGYFQAADIPAVIWGPGSIAQAHKPDEFIEISQLNEYKEKLMEIIRDFCLT